MEETIMKRVAARNGWDGQGSPIPFLPLALVSEWKDATKGSEKRDTYEFIAHSLKTEGISLSKLVRRSPNRTLFDVSETFRHESVSEVKSKSENRQGSESPEDGEDSQQGQRQQQEDWELQQAQQEGWDSQQGQQGQQQKQQQKQQKKRGTIREQTKALAESLKAQNAQADAAAKARAHASANEEERENAKSADVSNAGAFGGVVGLVSNVTKALRNRVHSLISNMSGGFDMEPTHDWDYKELAVRMATSQGYEDAKREEDGRPILSLSCDVSGSCSVVAKSSTDLAYAASTAGSSGSDVWVFKHSNGFLITDDQDVTMKSVSAARSVVGESWTLRNGSRFRMLSALPPEQAMYKNSRRDENVVERHRFIVHRIATAAGNSLPQDDIPGFRRTLLTKIGRKNAIDQRHDPLHENPSSAHYYHCSSAIAVLAAGAEWNIVFTDEDSVFFVTALMLFGKPDQKVVWVDYRTLPTHWNSTRGSWYTKRIDGEHDSRNSGYSQNEVTFGYGNSFWSSVKGESRAEAKSTRSLVNVALRPRFRGDMNWAPSALVDSLLVDVSHLANFNNFYYIPNAQGMDGLLDALALVARQDLLLRAVETGKSVMDAMFAKGSVLTGRGSWNEYEYKHICRV